MHFAKATVILFVCKEMQRKGVTELDLSNMRKAIGFTQKDMAQRFGISVQAYYRKEKGYTPFSDEEKVIFRDLVNTIFPYATIDSIFFQGLQRNAKNNMSENK